MPFGKSEDYEASPNAIANYVVLDEPPDADPHVRWCERGRLAAAPYSISRPAYGEDDPPCEATEPTAQPVPLAFAAQQR